MTGSFMNILEHRKITPSGCWIWTGRSSKKINGYGKVFYEERDWYTHRLTMKVFIPDEYHEYLEV